MNFTKLPFVFAVWVSFKDLPEEFLNKFNNALAFGLSNKHLVISNYIKKNPDTKIDIENYLNTRINYYLDPEKKRGMDKFLSLLKSI
jgi:chorismate dehydratase